MKMLLLLTSVALSSSVFGKTCPVSLSSEIRLDGQQVAIHSSDGQIAQITANDQLKIAGQLVPLNATQRQALVSYREHLTAYLPKAQQVAEQTLELADGVLDDVAKSIDTPNAFEPLKVKMRKWVAQVKQQYYQNGQFVLSANEQATLTARWHEEATKAKAMFSQEFMASAFSALSEKMQQEGGVNLSELSQNMSELTKTIEQRLRAHSQSLDQQGELWCQSLKQLAKQEEALREAIPELNAYPVLTER